MSLFNKTSASSAAPGAGGVNDFTSKIRAKLGDQAGESGDGCDTTKLGEAIRQGFGTQAFLDAGAKDKKWISIPKTVRDQLIAEADASGQDGAGIVAALDRAAAQINQFLARADVDAPMKLQFLSEFLAPSSGDYDHGDQKGGKEYLKLGTVLGQVLSGKTDVFFDGVDLHIQDVDAMAVDLGTALTDWMKKNEISVKPDTSRQYFADMTLQAEADRKRRQGMSPSDIIDDIRANRDRVRQQIRDNKVKDATPPEVAHGPQ